MADQFLMPKLGLTMEAGTIVQWLVDDGSTVEPGQAVLVIETDKVQSEVEATTAGRLHQTGQVGEEYACGIPVGLFLGDGEQAPDQPTVDGAGAARSAGNPTDQPVAAAARPPTNPTGVGGRLLASPNARRVAAERGLDIGAVIGTGPGGRIVSEDVVLAASMVGTGGQERRDGVVAGPGRVAPSAGTPSAGRTLATFAARRLADLLGIDLAEVVPSGSDPRLSKEDVAAHVRAGLAVAGRSAPTSGAKPAPGAAEAMPPLQTPSSIVPLTGMRGIIATRMKASIDGMAQLTLTMDVDMTGVVADRERRKGGGVTPGYTDYIIAATAQALVEHPVVNSQITPDGLALLPAVHVGLAVAIDDGLLVPVIRNTLGFDLDALATETSRLAEAARTRSLRLDEMEGGTFSVTTLGMLDVDAFTPIVNRPNTAILGVGRIRDGVAWTADDRPTRIKLLTLSLTWDHRAFDGAPAAEFTRSIKRRLEAYGR